MPTIREIAEDRNLWEQYMDPDNNEPGAFDRMSVEAKMKLLVNLWPQEVAEDDEEGQKLIGK